MSNYKGDRNISGPIFARMHLPSLPVLFVLFQNAYRVPPLKGHLVHHGAHGVSVGCPEAADKTARSPFLIREIVGHTSACTTLKL